MLCFCNCCKVTYSVTDFYQENYSDDKSPSSREIDQDLGEKMDSDLANLIDSMTGKEAAELLDKLLDSNK